MKTSRPGMQTSRIFNPSRWLLLLLAAVLSAPAFGAKKPIYAPTGVEMVVQQVGPHSYYVQGQAGVATDNEGFISNAGFVVTDAGVVVLDALGTPSLAAKLRGLIRQVTD